MNDSEKSKLQTLVNEFNAASLLLDSIHVKKTRSLKNAQNDLLKKIASMTDNRNNAAEHIRDLSQESVDKFIDKLLEADTHPRNKEKYVQALENFLYAKPELATLSRIFRLGDNVNHSPSKTKRKTDDRTGLRASMLALLVRHSPQLQTAISAESQASPTAE